MKKLAAAALAALAFPASAFGHAELRQATPDFRERLESAPPRVSLLFTQEVTPSSSSIEVRTAHGRLVSRPTTRSADRRVLEANLDELGKGAYTVRWNALSGDGHVVSGVFTFGVRAPAPPPSEAYGAGGPTAGDHAVRWLYFLSLALLLGGLAFRLLVVRDRPSPAFERRFYVLTAVGAVATIDVGVLAFLLRAEDALQLPFGRLLYGDLSPIASGTRFGLAFIAMTLGYAVVAALLFLGWLTDRVAPLWAALLAALGFASGLSLSGHSGAARAASWLSVLADWVHLTAATIWLGGLVTLAVCLWPAAPELRRLSFVRFSRLAGVLVALLVTAGVYLSVLRLPEVSDLWSASYGRILLVKLGLVSLALSWGAVHHFLVRPRVEAGRTPSGLPRSLAAESAIGMAILLVAAVLVDSRPPL